MKGGKRLESSKTVVFVAKNGQYSTTIPRAIAKGHGLEKGSILNWEILQDGIKLKKQKKEA